MTATRRLPTREAAPAPGARALRIAGPALAVLVSFVALLVALRIGGATDPVQGADLGPLVLTGRPVVQLLVNLAASVVLGAVLLTAFALPTDDPRRGRLLDGAAAAAGVWAVAAAVMVFLSFRAQTSIAITDPGFGPTLISFIGGIPIGQLWTAAAVLAAVLSVLLVAVRSTTGVGLLVAATVGALIPMALQGHSADSPGDHGAAIVAFGMHIVGAAAWLGGLGVLLVLGARMRGRPLADLASRYSSIALVAFVVVGWSGVVSAWIRVGSLAGLATAYGVLILVKTAALVVAGLLGALHRTVVIPRIADGSGRRPFLRLVAVELLVLGVASGFAAALAASAPPELAIPPATTPAQILTDAPLPPPFGPVTLVTQWRLDPLWLLVCVLLAIWYLAGMRRLRARGDAWPVRRAVCWLAGLAVLLWITNGALSRYQDVLFSAHMMAHMALTMLVPLLLVPAAPVTLALRAIRRRTDGSRGPREWILWAVHSPVGRVLANPIVDAVLFAGSLVVFYWSPLFRWAVTDHVGHEWMTVHFLITGYLFVQSMIGIDPVPFRLPHPIRLLVLLATMAFHAFFGLTLILGRGLLLADWYGAMGWGTSALADQQAAGAIAWSVGEIPTLILAIAVAVDWARSDEREAKRRDRAEDRSGDAELAAYNAMLSRLQRGGA